MFKIKTVYLHSFILSLCLWFSGIAQSAESLVVEEYQLKSVFLFNFAKFVKWPSTIFQDSRTPFYICIIGEDPFKQVLDIAIENESIENHPVLIERLDNIKNAESCQIVFIAESEKENLSNIILHLENYPVLTVSDIEFFMEKGGMIQFFKLDKKVRLLINPDKTKAVGLQISANLLRIAKIFHLH
jgi:hypothetical protein